MISEESVHVHFLSLKGLLHVLTDVDRFTIARLERVSDGGKVHQRKVKREGRMPDSACSIAPPWGSLECGRPMGGW